MTPVARIAKKAGCSETTVRRVLRGGNKEVWSSTAKRASEIRRIARDVGFLPNASAAAVKKGRFNAVLLILSTDKGRCHMPEILLHSLCSALEKAGQHLRIGRFSDEVLTDRETLPTFLGRWSCDGAIVNYTDRFPLRINELLAQYRIPSVWINAPFENDCVRYDDRKGGYDAAMLLIKHGCRRPLYVDLRHDWIDDVHHSAIERPAGFADALKAAGRSVPEPINLGHLPAKAQMEELMRLLRDKNPPDGIVSFDRAERILYAAAYVGLKIPDDFSLVTFSDGQSDFAGLPVMQMVVPCKAAAFSAVKTLMKKIESGGKGVKLAPLKLKFVSCTDT
ncbi:MAG: LacI family transcriptional regulator [Lentisphaerae bacterium]|jgi:LacI family transcriptional regulator|nr:LacI family transcriptional regulator [Lentisphaerota bacterium]